MIQKRWKVVLSKIKLSNCPNWNAYAELLDIQAIDVGQFFHVHDFFPY